ncbi:MAG: YqgE/AlgH family protein [Acidimicrobiales bacterium]
MSSLRGRLLVASPTMLDPSFHRTVVLLIEHGEEGALGLVLNRATEMAVGEILPAWVPFVAAPDVVFVGGPVQRTGAICLGRSRASVRTRSWAPVFADIGTVDVNEDPSGVPGVDPVRVFAGHAGWGPLQLEDEVDEGAWVVCDASSADVLDAEPDRLWGRVVERQAGVLPLLARFPPDPTLN